MRLETLRRVAAGVLAGVFALQIPAAHAASRRLVPDDFYQVQEVSDPQVSPDGRWVAYVVTSNDRESDEARSAIWMVSFDGSERLALTGAAEGTEKPRWSPDGRYLAFLARPPGADEAQIMLLDRRGGEARALTKVSGEIDQYAWAPDGKRLVLSMEEGEADKPAKPIVIEAWHFKQDEDGYLSTGRKRHLYLIEVGSRHLEPLTTDAAFDDALPVWSPLGGQIAFVRTHDRGVDRDGQADIVTTEARPGAEVRTLVRAYVPNAQKLAWSPDGRLVAYLEGLEPKLNAYMQDRLFVVPAAGGAPRALTDTLDRAVMSYAFTSPGSITIAVEDDRTVYPERVDLASGKITREVSAAPFSVASISAAAGHTALIESSDHALGEVYALERGHLRKLSAHNDAWLSQVELGAVEDIQFTNRSGTEIHGLLVKPPGFEPGRRYPLLLWIHGGPNGQDEHALELDGYAFPPQMFAARGFLVLRVNYRGSSGRGIEFAKAIFADWGDKEVADLLAGVDHVVALGAVDRERLAIGGWSYGGILTDYTIATDSRFNAAVSGAGSANQLSTYGSDEYILQYDNELGPPWRDTALWLKVSYPFFHADRIHTPTLFLGGTKDFNVPIIGGEQMYQALRTLGVPAQLVIYPGEHHVLTRPSFVKDLAERMTGWIDAHIDAHGTH